MLLLQCSSKGKWQKAASKNWVLYERWYKTWAVEHIFDWRSYCSSRVVGAHWHHLIYEGPGTSPPRRASFCLFISTPFLVQKDCWQGVQGYAPPANFSITIGHYSCKFYVVAVKRALRTTEPLGGTISSNWFASCKFVTSGHDASQTFMFCRHVSELPRFFISHYFSIRTKLCASM